MGNEVILRDIRSGLTGDRKQDAVCLLRQAVRCRDSGYGEAVVNEIGRMIFSLIPGVDDGNIF
jgi:hypothetical protein